MIRVLTQSLKNGMKVAKPIYDIDEKLLIGRGVILNEDYIQKLKDLHVSSLFIHEENTDDIIPYENISHMLRDTTISHLKNLFQSFEDIKKELYDNSTNVNIDIVSTEKFNPVFLKNSLMEKINDDIIQIINQLINREMMIGLTPVKTDNNYKFEHLVDVAIVSIMIGLQMGLSSNKLHELGIGCLLHDIGEIFIPHDILNKPSKLNPHEIAQIQNHPLIGYKLLKEIPGIGIIPAQVALQHHEKQDGTGYPHRLHGQNKVVQTQDTKVIHTFGSIAAVAEIYDALSSDRAYRKAFLREKVIELMQDMTDKNLNREILGKFLKITPKYPEGTIVRLKSRDYNNHLCVVSDINMFKLDRPKIRLIYNPEGKLVAPIDINLVNIDEDDMEIESVT